MAFPPEPPRRRTDNRGFIPETYRQLPRNGKKSKLNVGTSLGWEANCRYVSVAFQGFEEKCRYVSEMGRELSGRLWDLDRGPAKCRDVSGMGRELSGRRWDLGRGSAKCRDVSWMKKLLGQRKERA